MASTATLHQLPLESGDRLTRDEFERRYRCHPEIKKAELIEGIVYVASPVSLRHASPHAVVIAWLAMYAAGRPGLVLADNATVRLDVSNEPQPDALLAWDAEHGGQAHVGDDHYLEGAPELVVEVAASSAAYDLHDQKEAYRRNGVREYIVWQLLEERIDWFRLHEGAYRAVQADAQGVIHSTVFPGLRLDVAKMLAGDITGVVAALTAQ